MGNINGGAADNGKQSPSRRSSASGSSDAIKSINGGGDGVTMKASTSGMSRSASGTDINEKNYTPFVPVEKLAKILQQKSSNEYGINGISRDSFVKYVFPSHPDLGYRLFCLLHTASKAQTKHIGIIAFRQQCERFLGMLDDAVILENYVKMFCEPEHPDSITPDGLKGLLMTCFKLAMEHYTNGGPGTQCPLIERTLNAVTVSCFFSKESLSPGFVCRWLEQNCPRLVPPVHRYCLHTLTTAYRGIQPETGADGNNLSLELATPILDNANPFDAQHPPLMPVSQAWLLAGTLPILYAKPQPVQSPANSGNNLASTAFMAKMLSVVPSHWTLLYDSCQHGVGANRFLHHVLGYKGPTLVMLKADNEQVFCIASPSEWRETHLYTGDKGCCVIQVLPKFQLLESGPKLLYLNTSQRGYPKGLRAGSDPRKPVVSVDEHFEKIDCRGISSILLSIEVWGCGDKQSRDIQMDIKKWQIKEAERQRTVKLTAADWLDNPDRYLLELGGRPQYNNSTK